MITLSNKENKEQARSTFNQKLQQESTIPTVDDLARVKVNEIEASLNTATKYKLGQIRTWFLVLKRVITSADLHQTQELYGQNTDECFPTKSETGDSIYADYIDDYEQFNATDLTEQLVTNPVKWTIRVQAFKNVHRIVEIIASLSPASCDPSYLLGYLEDLVRLSFVAATSPYDDLKLQGFSMFKFIIKRFARLEDKELKGQSILEQYRTQILSALKPAFNLDAPPYIAAIASQVCSLWMIQGLDRNIFDMKRTYQLFIASLHKLDQQNTNQHSQLYTESELEQERLDILGSWAYLFIASQDRDYSDGSTGKNQLSRDLSVLIEPCLDSLVDKWWEAMRDYALLIIPAPRLTNNLHENDSVYTREVALRLFHPIWPKLTLALTIWLCRRHDRNKHNCDQIHQIDTIKCSKFLWGIIVKELCDCQSSGHPSQRAIFDSTIYSFRALDLLMNDKDICQEIVGDAVMVRELYLLLYGAYVKNCRDPNKALLRKCMDSLFSASLIRICERSCNTALYSAAQSLAIVQNELDSIQSQSEEKPKEPRFECRDRLIIAIGNFMTILNLKFEQVSTDTDLMSHVIEICKRIVEFEPDRTLGYALISQSRDLYDRIKHHKQGLVFISQIFFSKAKQLSWSMNGIDKKDPKSPASFEMILKSMLLDLDTCPDNTYRKSMSQRLGSELLKSVHSKEGLICRTGSELTLETRKYLLALIVKIIKELIATHADDLEEGMVNQLQVTVKLQQETQEELSPNKITIPESTSSRQLRSPAKITLRSDFSNFYCRKL